MDLTSQKVLSGLEHEELQKMLQLNEQTDFRNTTFIWMLLHTGARVSEVLAIRPKDLLPGPQVFIRGLKNSNDRELPLTGFLFDRMKFLARGLGEDEKVFPFEYSNAAVIWQHWRPAKKKIHSLRHFRAMEIYRKSKDIRLVQRVLGHKSMMTTMIYTEYDYSAQELRRALM